MNNNPNGASSWGLPILPGMGTFVPPQIPGKVFFVNSNGGASGVSAGGAHNGGQDPNRPYATIGAALTAATANKNDIIFVMAGHSETITGAGGITMSKAGVSVVGMGIGARRPRFLMDGADTVTWLISGANCLVRNVVLAAGHADIVTGIGVSAADVWIDGVEFVNNVVDENFLTEIKLLSTTDNNADGFKVTNCRAMTIDAGGLEFLEINADVNRMVAQGNFVSKDAATAGKFILQATGKDLRDVLVDNNTLITGMTAGDLLIDNDTAVNSGVVSRNFIGHHDTAGAVPIDCDGVRLFENYAAFEDTTQGTLQPVAGTLA
jgi:hypothetical protein